MPHSAEILSINTGLSLDKTHWPYVGFKGGSEPGVLNLTFVLRDKDRRWFAFSMCWNNLEREVDQAKLIGFAQRIIRLGQKVP